MALFAATFVVFCWQLVTSSGQYLHIHSIPPNVTASYLEMFDQAGVFLQSLNATFKASISAPNPNPNPDQRLPTLYFSVIHSSSHTVIWTANRNTPISESAKLSLNPNGLFITDDLGRVLWSTPNLHSRVAFMQLDDSGNLLLLDQANLSLWESFDYPTDTLVMGQRLPVGADFSVGDYRLVLSSADAVLQWKEMTYWGLSMDNRAFKDSNAPLSFMSLNDSGLYLLGDDGSRVVFQVILAAAGLEFIFAKLGSDGKFSISGYDGSGNWMQVFQFPAEDCRIPSSCGKLGFCSTGTCSCPPAFHYGIDGCVPINPGFTLPQACTASTSNGSKTNYQESYLKFGDSIDYFATNFIKHLIGSLNLSYCQQLCSQNCSCLGVLYANSSGSCYPIQNNVGSFFSSTIGQESFSGYVKTVTVFSDINQSSRLSVAVLLAVLSSSGFLVLVVFVVAGFVWWRRRKWHSRTAAVVRLGSKNSKSFTEAEIISIPGLPVRFKYEELEAATDNFKTEIGSGGFGTVYKGRLPNESVVAVKKMTNLGVEGKKDFCTEIGIIGNIHHVNLVKLTGFCVQGEQRFLVYEYMNRGSLDHAIFNGELVVEWKERVEIALGTARGLAYLHTGCQHKIIHCDVKPENILLHNNLQVKISDFGISKLLTPEQSNLLTTLRGTRGYLAPEWLTSSGISEKSDVYSFGMVLLEIVRGRRNFSIQIPSNSSCCASVQRLYFPLLALEMHEQKRYLELADPRLEGRVKSEEVEKLVRVALCCVQLEPRLRPPMSSVVGMLEGSLPLGIPRIESLKFLRFYGRRYAEAVTTSTDGSNEFIPDHHPIAPSNHTSGSGPVPVPVPNNL